MNYIFRIKLTVFQVQPDGLKQFDELLIINMCK